MDTAAVFSTPLSTATVKPLVGLASLTILLIAHLLVDGAAALWLSRRLKSDAGRVSVGLSGALSLVLAALVFVGFQADAAWALGLLVGVSLLATGLSTTIVALRRAQKRGVDADRDRA